MVAARLSGSCHLSRLGSRAWVYDLPLAYLAGVARAVELDEPDDPGDVRLLGPPAVMLDAEGLTHAIKEPGHLRRGVGNFKSSLRG